MPGPDTSSFSQATSAAEQQAKSLTTGIKDLGSAISDKLSSSGPALGAGLAALTALSPKLASGGIGAGIAVAATVSQLGSLGSTSKFKDTFKSPAKLRDMPPEKSKRQGLEGLTYPKDLPDYFISLVFKTYDRKAPIGNPIDLPKTIINLPMPTNLQEQFSMQYADRQLGLAGFFEDVARTALEGGGSAQSFEAAGKKLNEKAISPEGLYYGARTFAGMSDTIGGAVDKVTGTVLNPFQSLLFQGVSLRSHTFSFRFSPNNQEEVAVLKEIIFKLKQHMHPQLDGLLYQFPDVCDISFGKSKDSPYKFKTCFLESMSVNHAPQGSPAFFKETFTPVETEISLTFKEVEPLTRGDI